MNKNRNRLIFLLTGLIFISFIALSMFGFRDYSLLIEGLSIEATELYSQNTKLEIEKELTKPLYIAQIISKTIVLENMTESKSERESITDYLDEVKSEYDYSAVYFIATDKNRYFESSGFEKTIQPDRPEDKWVYDFINKGVDYELLMKKRPSVSQELMLYVNYAVKDSGDLIGIVGIGVSLKDIQAILAAHSDDIDGNAFLSNKDGSVQIYAGPRPIDPLELGPVSQNRDEIFVQQDDVNIFFAQTYDGEAIFASYYIEDIDLYLVVNENYEYLDFLLLYQKIRIAVIFIVAFLLVAILVIKITSHFHKKNIKLASTDYLTEVPNRNAFDESLKQAVDLVKEKNADASLAVIDVDNFKTINDVYGHITGDNILKSTADHFKSFIRDNDIVARWGGDEFAVIFRCDIEHTKKILNRLKDAVEQDAVLSKYAITYSIGATQCKKDDDVKSLLDRADKALYQAKENGKNQIFPL